MADFESKAYQPCKEWIAKQIDSHKSWDDIKDLCVAPSEFDNELETLIDEESWPLRLNKSTWLEFVDYYKGNLIIVRNADAEEVVAIDNGGLANHFPIPTGYTSSWEKYKGYGTDKDSKCKWHIRMQSLFPPESIEYRFYDKETRELKDIADVFLGHSNTVIEFQHSPISDEDFRGRTMFHISEGRRVVWVFDESKEKSEYGRLKLAEDSWLGDWLHKKVCFEWPRSPRKVIKSVCDEQILDTYNNFCICIYLGDEKDVIHRIIKQEYGFESIVLSLHEIELKRELDEDEFFLPEDYWLLQSPWKELIEENNQKIQAKMEAEKEANTQYLNSMLNKLRPKRRRL